MAKNTRITTQAVLVTGGIAVAFVAFLLMVFIPSSTYFLLLNLGIFGLVLVGLASVTPASRPALLRFLAGEEDWAGTGPFPALSWIITPLLLLLIVGLVIAGGFLTIIVVAMEIGVLCVVYFLSRSINPDGEGPAMDKETPAGGRPESPEQEPVVPDLPEIRGTQPPNPFWFRIFTLGFGLLAALYFLYEVRPLYEAGIPVPPRVIVTLAFLIILFCGLVWRSRSLPPAEGEMRRVQSETASATRLLLSLCQGPLLPFILITALFNGGIALVLVLARDKVISLSLAHANGFILFLVYTFGNLLILAIALLYLERNGHLTVGENSIKPSPAASSPPGPTQKNVLSIIVFGFTALYFIGPMLAFGLGFVGPEAHDNDILVTVDHPDPSTVVVTYLGGKDAGTLVGLDASCGYLAADNAMDHPYRKVIAQGFLGMQKGTEPVPVNRTIVMNVQCPGSCTVGVTGYFSDGRYQELYSAPL